MDQQQQSQMQQSPIMAGNDKPAQHLLIIAILVVVLIVLGGIAFWILSNRTELVEPPMVIHQPSVPAPALVSSPRDDSQGAIEQDLNAAKDPDLDQEFRDIDSELNNL